MRRPLALDFVLSIPLAAALLCVTSGCEDRARNEARMVMDRYDAIDQNDPPDVRRPRVADLATLSVTNQDVVRARDTCVRFHEAMLGAEDSQRHARLDLEAATRGDEKHLDSEVARRISQSIRESEAAIRRARELFPRCDSEMRGLRDRYGLARAR